MSKITIPTTLPIVHVINAMAAKEAEIARLRSDVAAVDAAVQEIEEKAANDIGSSFRRRALREALDILARHRAATTQGDQP